MTACKLLVTDQINCSFVGLDPLTRRKIVEATKYFVPYARHTPSYKLGRWDGTVAFATIGGHTYVNILEKVLPIVEDAGYEIELDDQRTMPNFNFQPINENLFADRTWPEGHTLAGQPIVLRDYQVEAANTFLANPQSLQEISTAAGKTISVAALCHRCEPYGRSIVIVPNKSLVSQTEDDFRNLNFDTGVYYGDRKELGRQHTICTWQSLSVLLKKSKAERAEFPIDEFLRDVVCVIVDEAHTGKAVELKALLSGPFANVPVRWGLTGTIPKEEFDYLTLVCTIGPLVGQIKAKQLQDAGYLADCDIKVVQLHDDHVAFNDYHQEHKWLTTDDARLRWIADYIQQAAATGNTLVLVSHIATGRALQEMIQDSVFIQGSVATKDRKQEYDAVQVSTNKVIVATYGVAAVGINVPRIFNLVMIECGKAFTRTIQSIGRALRKANDKDSATVHDICSSLKFSARHLSKRKTYYKEAQYRFTVNKVRY